MGYSDRKLEQISARMRLDLLRYIKLAGAGHTGGDLSCIDILNVLYNDVLNVSPGAIDDADRDRYIQSKGHSVEALYVVLASKGFFPESDLETIGRYRSHYVGHPTRKVNGIEFNTGALGHGLSISAGIALAGKMDKRSYRVFTMLGDGELAEGSNWEAAMFAAHNRLDNLVAILDHNNLQITDKYSRVCNPSPIDEKFKSFGWGVTNVDGHNIKDLRRVLSNVPLSEGLPTLIIADTVKGRGVSFMENVLKWHHGVPDDAQYEAALKELEERLSELSA
ncbi:MAG: transketolase [Marinilabiliales bacterium]|nr:MAG: transketolase [Marinilabiliales bacterium]